MTIFNTDNYTQILTNSTDGIICFPIAEFGGFILIRFGLKRRENDFVAL